MSIYHNGRFIERPPIVGFDYETALTSGIPSTRYYRSDFRIVSCAFSWPVDGGLDSVFVEGEEATGNILRQLVAMDVPLVVHNLQFELGCTVHRFPDLAAYNNYFDTMRLVQVYDNGGSDYDDFTPETIYIDREMAELDKIEADKSTKKKVNFKRTGLGLAASIKRLLDKRYHDHKGEAYEYLRSVGVAPGKEGANLHLLPKDILARYNIGDSDNTLRLYFFIAAYLSGIDYDWKFDHHLYRASVRRLVSAESKGVRVDRATLEGFRDTVVTEIAGIGAAFRSTFLEQIVQLETEAMEKEVMKLKTVKGQANRRAKYAANPVLFNVGSNLQLGKLFVDKLGIKPPGLTDTGRPAFRSAILELWGEGGLILLKRRKRLLVQKQADALLELSAYDGRWHPQLKACGTKTGRYAGGQA